MKTSFCAKIAGLAFVAVLMGWSAGFAQGADTAYVPFLVNVNATVTAVPAVGTASVVSQVQMSATGGVEGVLRIPLPKASGVLLNGAQRQLNVPAIVSNGGGKVTLNLPAQSYKNAKIVLYTIAGKQILRKNVSASNNVSRLNIATGAYLLSVDGANGNVVTSRLTHSGGSLDINVIFGGEDQSSRLAKRTGGVGTGPDGGYRITVSAAGYVDTSYAFYPVKGTNTRQNITLRSTSSGWDDNSFTDARDGQTYKTAYMPDGKVWMAQNLNYAIPDNSWCYDDNPSNCVTYGRLYGWNTAITVCPSGWHLPSHQEWGELAGDAGGGARSLKSTSGWDNNGNGEDFYGFSALPGGYSYGVVFAGVGNSGYWWTATSISVERYCRSMESNFKDVREESLSQGCGLSVRCVRDEGY